MCGITDSPLENSANPNLYVARERGDLGLGEHKGDQGYGWKAVADLKGEEVRGYFGSQGAVDPDVAGLRRALTELRKGMGGGSSTLLTGARGLAADQLNLGRVSLLGS